MIWTWLQSLARWWWCWRVLRHVRKAVPETLGKHRILHGSRGVDVRVSYETRDETMKTNFDSHLVSLFDSDDFKRSPKTVAEEIVRCAASARA